MVQKQFSEKPQETLTQGLPDSRAATVASSLRHKPFIPAVEELLARYNSFPAECTSLNTQKHNLWTSSDFYFVSELDLDFNYRNFSYD